MNDLQITTTNLPEDPIDLSRFVLVELNHAKAIKAEIHAIKRLKLADEVWKQKQLELHAVQEAIIEAERRIGVLFNEMPKQSGRNKDLKSPDVGLFKTSLTRQEKAEELGFSKQEVNRFQTLAKHPEAIEEAKAHAKANNTDLTTNGVINLIRYKERKQDEAYYRDIEDEKQFKKLDKALSAIDLLPDDLEGWKAIYRGDSDRKLTVSILETAITTLQSILSIYLRGGI